MRGRLPARLRAHLGDVVDMLRAVGPRRGPIEVSRWLVRREFVVLAGRLPGQSPPGPPPSDLRFTGLTPEDVPALARLHPMMFRAEVERRWTEGQQCIVGWIGVEPAYYRWDSNSPAYLGYLGKTLLPPPLTVLTLDVRTHPGFQQRRIGLFGAALANRRGLEQGQRHRLGLVASWNRHVLRYNLAHGASVRGTVGYWRSIDGRRYFTAGDVHIEGATVRVAAP